MSRLESQGTLKPGDEGYWRVWGSHALDIKPGDLILCAWKDSDNPAVIHHAEYEVVQLAPWPDKPIMNGCRVRFLATNGEYESVGMLQPMELYRPGTGNYLSDYAR
jgi:hypothetical protein